MKQQIIGILLAAGKSSRMKQNKLELALGHTNIGSFTLQQAILANIDHLLVVVKKGDSAQWIQSKEEHKSKWSIVECEEAFRGQSFSLKAGVKAAEKMNASAVIVLLGDQPFVSTRVINLLIHTHKRTSSFFVASRFQGIPRPPVLFSFQLFPVLANLHGDRGAGSLLKKTEFLNNGRVIDFQDGQLFLDIDTKSDYEQATRRVKCECADAHANKSMAAYKFNGSSCIKKTF